MHEGKKRRGVGKNGDAKEKNSSKKKKGPRKGDEPQGRITPTDKGKKNADVPPKGS